jgi:branched-chain amino acid transport system substrate-binding protein
MKVKQSAPQAIYLAAYPTDGATILKQAKQLGLQNKFVGSIAIVGGRQFFDLANDAAEGMLVVSSAPNHDTGFFRDYNNRYPGEAPAQIIYAARAYDAMMVTGKALIDCGQPETACIRDKLFGIKNYLGASGTFSFDSNGDIVGAPKLFKVRERSFTEID